MKFLNSKTPHPPNKKKTFTSYGARGQKKRDIYGCRAKWLSCQHHNLKRVQGGMGLVELQACPKLGALGAKFELATTCPL